MYVSETKEPGMFTASSASCVCKLSASSFEYIATVGIPRFFAHLIILHAISPRFAINNFFIFFLIIIVLVTS